MPHPADLGVRAERHALLSVLHRLLVEVDVAQMKDGRQDPHDRVLLERREAQNLHGRHQRLVVLGVVLRAAVHQASLRIKRQSTGFLKID